MSKSTNPRIHESTNGEDQVIVVTGDNTYNNTDNNMDNNMDTTWTHKNKQREEGRKSNDISNSGFVRAFVIFIW